MSRVTIAKVNNSYVFAPLSKNDSGKIRSIKEGSFLGKKIKVGGKSLSKNSLINYINAETGNKKLKKGFLGLRASSDQKVVAALNSLFENPINVVSKDNMITKDKIGFKENSPIPFTQIFSDPQLKEKYSKEVFLKELERTLDSVKLKEVPTSDPKYGQFFEDIQPQLPFFKKAIMEYYEKAFNTENIDPLETVVEVHFPGGHNAYLSPELTDYFKDLIKMNIVSDWAKGRLAFLFAFHEDGKIAYQSKGDIAYGWRENPLKPDKA